MLETLNDLVVRIMDCPLGWILCLPRDLMLFVVAVMTSGILTLTRRLTADQHWLRRADEDKQRLEQLIRQARQAGDGEAVKRHKATITLIKARALRYEGKPLLWALVPVALLATWAFARLAYEPPRAGQTLEVKAYFGNSDIGRLVHLVPDDRLAVVNGYVQSVVKDTLPEPQTAWARANRAVCSFLAMTPQPEGVAVWRVKPAPTGQDLQLRVRYEGRTYDKDLIVGRRVYAAPFSAYAGAPVQFVEVVSRPVRLFGVIEGIDFLFLPPWLVAYLLIAIPFVSILKRLCRVH